MINLMIPHTISEEDISDLFSAAWNGGINYWAVDYKLPEDFVPSPKNECLVEKMTECIKLGGTVKIAEDPEEEGNSEDFKWYDLTLETLTKGFELYFARPDATTEVGDWDSEVSDIIMQYALFGEIVYG